MLGFAYEVPEEFQTIFYPTRSYEKIRSTRSVVIKQIRELNKLHPTSTRGDLVLYVAVNKVTFSSIKEAAAFYNIEIGHLGQVLRGKFKTNRVKGLAFEFVL